MAKTIEQALHGIERHAAAAAERRAVAMELEHIAKEVAAADSLAAVALVPCAQHPDARVAPNEALRSALFAALPRDQKRRALLRGTVLASLQGVKVEYTGQQLDQRDLDLWLALLYLCRGKKLGEVVEVSSYQLLKAQGLTDTGAMREDLKASLLRLNGGQVVLTQGKRLFAGHIVAEAKRSADGARWRIRLSPAMAEIFGPQDWTGIDWPVRRELRGKPLAQWLHGYLSSHGQAHALRVETLRVLSGGRAAPRSFSSSLRRALAALERAAARHGRQFNWNLPPGGLLSASRPRGQ